MNADRGRDQSIEPLLRRSLRAGAGAPASDACLDGETLAAWVDGGLDEHARATAEAHVSGCARCQALVGVMARSAPDLAAPAPWWRWSWKVRWLVPLAAGAAAVALWVMVPEPPPIASRAVDSSLSTPALADQARPAAPPVAAPAPAVPPPQVAEPVPSAAAPAPRAAPGQAPSTAPFAPEVPLTKPGAILRAPQEPPARAAEEAAATDKRVASSDREGARPDLEKDRLGRDRLESNTRARGAAGAAKPADEQTLSSAPTPKVLQESVTIAAAKPAAEAPTAAQSAPAAAPPPASLTFRSAPLCGATWRQLPTGVPVELVAGSSPSTSVCWVIGRAGTVLLSTDGRTWTRVPFPEPIDLKTVQAIDARTATVTTIDGRTFRTTDAGKTWNRP